REEDRISLDRTLRAFFICSSTSLFSLASRDTAALSRKFGMTPNASAAHSHTHNAGTVRLAAWTLAVVAALTVSQYLSRYLLLWSLKASPLRATPLTTLQYAYYYGAYP